MPVMKQKISIALLSFAITIEAVMVGIVLKMILGTL